MQKMCTKIQLIPFDSQSRAFYLNISKSLIAIDLIVPGRNIKICFFRILKIRLWFSLPSVGRVPLPSMRHQSLLSSASDHLHVYRPSAGTCRSSSPCGPGCCTARCSPAWYRCGWCRRRGCSWALAGSPGADAPRDRAVAHQDTSSSSIHCNQQRRLKD